MQWLTVEAKVAFWCDMLSIPQGKICLVRPKQFNKLNRPYFRKTDWGRCNYQTMTFTLAPARMSEVNADETILHELLHFLWKCKPEKWIDQQAELIAGHKRQLAILNAQKQASHLWPGPADIIFDRAD